MVHSPITPALLATSFLMATEQRLLYVKMMVNGIQQYQIAKVMGVFCNYMLKLSTLETNHYLIFWVTRTFCLLFGIAYRMGQSNGSEETGKQPRWADS